MAAMPQAAQRRLIGELAFTEISTRVSGSSILCLPIGSIEQHGPHLPLNTDVLLAEEFTRRIIDRWGDSLDLWQLPTLALSLAREHEWAPGTMSLSVHGMTALMRDLGREIARALPAKNLAIINGHGGNRGILEAISQDLRADFGLNVCVLHPAAWIEVDPSSAIPEIHGGKNETSMMLAIAPHLVRRDKIAQLKNSPDEKAIRSVILDPGVTWPWSTDDKRIANMGVIGDAQAASAEFGTKLLDHMGEAAGGVLNQLLDQQRFLHR
jgi:creatinine amidohydrolase/Fe(II)-dependent formamide hydrolase-like protein